VIVAIGQTLGVEALGGLDGVERTANGFVNVDRLTGRSSVPWLFCGGDAAVGPDSVVGAIAGGERAAVGIDVFLSGSSHAFWRQDHVSDVDYDPEEEPVPYPREAVRTIAVERRRHNFDEVEQPWCEAVAIRQAKRCLRCDYGKTVRAPVEPTKEELHA
jgi:NADH-quinone oxidoreductase subunit F